MTVLNVQATTFQVGGNGAAAGATSLPLQSFKDILGVNLAMTSFGSVGYGTIEPNTSQEDSITFSGITQNADGSATLTGVKSVGFISPYTASAGLRVSHAGSVPFIITNTAAYMSTFANKQNVETLTANWAVPDPVGDTDIANKQYVLSVVTGGAVTTNKVILSAQIAGETVSAGNIVYQKVADSRWWLADGNVTATVLGVKFGVALGAGTAGNAITGGVQLAGTCSAFTGLTANTKYYLSDTAGAVSTSVGTVGVEIGLATATTTILLNFNPVASETSAGIVEEATDAEVTAGTAVGATGSKLFVTPAKLKSSGLLKFGGTGADGALAISSGATNIDLASAAVVTKNYTSISITGTGSLTFSNPHANGTVVILKSQGAVTLTSSATPMIAGTNTGTAVGANSYFGLFTNTCGGNGTGGAGSTSAYGAAGVYSLNQQTYAQIYQKYPQTCIGSAGGNGAVHIIGGGSATAGTGGVGGGSIIIECGGAWNFTTTAGISVKGANGTAGTVVGSGGSANGASGGGGGGGGSFIALCNSITANTGTVIVAGGTAGAGAVYQNGQCSGAGGGAGAHSGTAGAVSLGNGSVGASGNGADGFSLVTLNTEFA